MKNIFIIILSTFMISNVAWGNPVFQPTTNSLSKAAAEINAMNAPPQTNMQATKINTHQIEKNNSLFQAVLAIQQAQMKRDPNIELNYSQTESLHRHDNSFFNAVLEKHFSHFN
jgi:hypothetical protein